MISTTATHACCLAVKLCRVTVTRRKLKTPGTAEEHKRQETPTINPIDRQPTHLTDQAPSTIERAARETQTPINTAAVHASAQQQPAIITLTQQDHHQILSADAACCEAQEQYTGPVVGGRDKS